MGLCASTSSHREVKAWASGVPEVLEAQHRDLEHLKGAEDT